MQRPAGHREVKLSLHDHPRQCLRDIVVNPQPDIWIKAAESRYRRGNQFIDRRRTAPDIKRSDPLNATCLQPGYRTVETIQQRRGFLHEGHGGSCRRRGALASIKQWGAHGCLKLLDRLGQGRRHDAKGRGRPRKRSMRLHGHHGPKMPNVKVRIFRI